MNNTERLEAKFKKRTKTFVSNFVKNGVSSRQNWIWPYVYEASINASDKFFQIENLIKHKPLQSYGRY